MTIDNSIDIRGYAVVLLYCLILDILRRVRVNEDVPANLTFQRRVAPFLEFLLVELFLQPIVVSTRNPMRCEKVSRIFVKLGTDFVHHAGIIQDFAGQSDLMFYGLIGH